MSGLDWMVIDAGLLAVVIVEAAYLAVIYGEWRAAKRRIDNEGKQD